jgi:eukaryotic-like serine/threonine-protein kinase
MIKSAMSHPAYQEEHLLGTGGMAEVWRARGPKGAVALKRLLPHAARDPSLAAAFEREGRLLSRIQHPNVVGIHDVVQDERGPCLVLEYVEGVDLRAAAGTQLEPRFALRVARDVLSALQAVHGLSDETGSPVGLIHRDLSPSNVLVGVDGRIKLTDFGIARALQGSHATTGHNIKGTLAYLSPEQATGAPVDARSDLFAVGALMYELLAGVPIYDEDDPRLALARARAGDVRSVSEARPGLPFPVVELVDRALSAAPADRFPGATKMLAEVERVAAQIGGLATNEELAAWARHVRPRADPEGPTLRGATSPFARPRRAPQRIAAAIAGVVAVLALVFWWRAKPREEIRSTARAGEAPAASVDLVSGARMVTADDLGGATTGPTGGAILPGTGTAPSPGAESHAAGPVGPSAPKVPIRNGSPAGGRSAAARGEAPAPGLLDLGSEPAFAYVTIDGVRVGPTPLFGREVAPGMHRIEVSREGLGSKTFTLEVRPGQRVSRVIKLP